MEESELDSLLEGWEYTQLYLTVPDWLGAMGVVLWGQQGSKAPLSDILYAFVNNHRAELTEQMRHEAQYSQYSRALKLIEEIDAEFR